MLFAELTLLEMQALIFLVMYIEVYNVYYIIYKDNS